MRRSGCLLCRAYFQQLLHGFVVLKKKFICRRRRDNLFRWSSRVYIVCWSFLLSAVWRVHNKCFCLNYRPIKQLTTCGLLPFGVWMSLNCNKRFKCNFDWARVLWRNISFICSFDVARKSLKLSATRAEGIKIVQPGNSFLLHHCFYFGTIFSARKVQQRKKNKFPHAAYLLAQFSYNKEKQ